MLFSACEGVVKGRGDRGAQKGGRDGIMLEGGGEEGNEGTSEDQGEGQV